MAVTTRVYNTKNNIISGLIKQAIGIILPFITRTMVLYALGVEYQGLNSLFSSILQVLNLADLGFSTAVIYGLYKPIAEKDTNLICSIVLFLKRVYFVVGSVILIAGVCISPFLGYLISGSYPEGLNIYVLFYIYLINTVISYWLFAYKSVLFTAMQKESVVSNIHSVISASIKLLQILILIITPNYYLYLLILPIGTIANNILLQVFSKKIFPQIIPSGRIPDKIKQDLIKQIKGIVINKVGDVARNGFDSIFVSTFLGLATVAVYDNYYHVYSALYGVTLMISQAMQASVGNSVATETVNKNYDDLNKFTFIYAWLTGWFTVSMFCLYQPFMNIWMRGNKNMLLSPINMVLFCLYFYLINMNNIRNLYINSAGLYWKLKFWYIAEAVGNILLNWVLGYYFDLTGIITATIITIFIFNFVTRSNTLFDSYFKRSKTRFYLSHLYYFMVVLINCTISYVVCTFVHYDGFLGLFIKGVICLFVSNIIFFMAFYKTKMYKISIKWVLNIVQREKERN